MQHGDLDAVTRIERASFPAPWSEAQFRDEIERQDRSWVVAEDDGALVGFGGVMVVDADAHVMDLAVDPGYRRRGVGRAVLWALAERALALGAARMTLEVAESNRAALDLYLSCGFDVAGRRVAYYPETGDDALVLWSRPIRSHIAAMRAAREGSDVVLAIESSCDETATAVMRGGRELLSSVVASQVDFHARFGGVVPEIASRKHTEAIVGVVDEALERAGVGFEELDAIAVTQGPGLVGALVVGVAYAKGLAFVRGLPLIGVNHLEGHLYAARLHDPTLEPPFVALVVSGGHTMLVHVPEWGRHEVLGRTLDDAAGEAFDKVAKLLGLGYPGGPVISRLAAQGDPRAIAFPRAMLKSGNLDVSLSGLKTAVLQYVQRERAAGRELNLPDIAASFQAAVIDVQVAKTLAAASERDVQSVVLAGGVAANAALREALAHALGERGMRLVVPPMSLCTDNAAMIAAVAHDEIARGRFLGLSADASAVLHLRGASTNI
ncbi:tRNA (adenosine(37)-N6)-threonylcarbamoyltransferase complex transferase subunit TsaD [Coriobacteriia bacterium Es71-Z0120]|uniref:tRNA (adenosine(37)-N6)-threonylcarbamoyltransferase complex transferase subunit TsaD n=1 Tax=Parvivirga hydrogeniphila TaxID=2939460 RepID=UPI002260ECD6|nr:tRNA (adenosine(37)-N6)-threonylcarbamoyltransferase complex transferase subunit TsaD [Parvivirga hydrogeniphila]MCL4078591.1 tRNA (adenosine(37)-N6)-threonylcarbamoyltransferase complex transferase subunit TsaD [Parvivirga hydrogeniphila]